MVSVAGSSISVSSLSASFKQRQASSSRFSSVKLVSVPLGRTSFPLRKIHKQGGLQVCCAAKPETVKKVIDIVKKQLVLSADSNICESSKFSEFGADSLDTVEIVMGLEEEFNISVEEDSAQSITTVQEAADLIEELIANAAKAGKKGDGEKKHDA